MSVFCPKADIGKTGVLVGRCCFILENPTGKLHSTSSAMYHLVLHASLSFFLFQLEESCQASLHRCLMSLCNAELGCSYCVKLYRLLFIGFDPSTCLVSFSE